MKPAPGPLPRFVVLSLAVTLAGGLAVLPACKEDAAGRNPACNPLGDLHCLLPWPSSFYEVADPSTATGRRIAVPGEALPKNINGVAIDPTLFAQADGFSAAAPILVAFEQGVSTEGLVGQLDMSPSLTLASPTLLLDLTTGELVEHFAEIDAQAGAPDRAALYLRPSRRLMAGHRYGVALTTALRDASGAPLPRPAGFAAHLAGNGSLPSELAAAVDQTMAAFAARGLAADDILLAWDFTVASDAYVRRDLLTARSLALAALEATPQTYQVDVDAVEPSGDIARIVEGYFDAPLLLTNGGAYQVDTVLSRDDAGLPQQVGTFRVPFSAVVPRCAFTMPQPVPVMVFGHGLMGAASEVKTGTLKQTAHALCMVVIGTDFRGMSTRDIGSVVTVLGDIGAGRSVFEVLVQGVVNNLALSHAVATVFHDELFVHDHDLDPATAPVPYTNPAAIHYYGLSQGHIFGATVLAMDPRLARGVLGVGGANYSLLLERSTDWPQYRDIMATSYPDALDRTVLINLLQQMWDHTEGAGISDILLTGDGQDLAAKQVLVHMALGDDQVPNLGTYWQARTMGLPMLTPSPTTAYGLATVGGLESTSALVVFDNGAAAPPLTNVPAPDTGAHYATRGQPAAWRQMNEFLRTGTVTNTCAGACQCHLGACE